MEDPRRAGDIPSDRVTEDNPQGADPDTEEMLQEGAESQQERAERPDEPSDASAREG